MCETSADCDQASGELCDQGVCWGNPPQSIQFAAVLDSPEGNDKYVPTELPSLAIDTDGTIHDLVLAEHVTISGRVVLACMTDANPDECNPDLSIAAQIKVVGSSRIPGGPDFSRTVDVEPGHPEGDIAFTLRLPRLAVGDEPYQVTITPDDQSQTSDVTPAQLAPPIRFALTPLQSHEGVDWVLGLPEEHMTVRGRVVDAAERGLAGMQVLAEGRWTPAGAVSRASSLSTTDQDGWFALRIPIARYDVFDLVIKPAPGVDAPWLRLRDVYIPDPEAPTDGDNSVYIDDLMMPSHADPLPFVLPVVGLDSGGSVQPVVGAEVRLVTTLTDDGRADAFYTAQGFTDSAGNVQLALIPGGGNQNRTYLAKITPPPSSEHASVENQTLTVGAGNPDGPSFLAGLTLSRRIAVHGAVVDADGNPVKGAGVTADVATRLKWSLALDEQAALDNLQWTTATTDETGTFTLWLDPMLAGVGASYDLDIVPPAGAYAPRWSVDDIEIGAANLLSGDKQLPDITLPRVSFARGQIVAGDGTPVGQAEFRLYQLVVDDTLCASAILPMSDAADCAPPAALRGVWHADDEGWVRVILPDPDR